ncbi:hypothetical protein BCR44DRAFT_43026 [Catenaria anguillulae PL171]|uniref:Uncharacterized protein n=1 Tax=Catenaria anguillulae PL171 TaxID=765915 RepID=A0A1Y2HSV6_9FUNG|nr:hypothetical protein BCR44DRAFT_43026 [Catenaria anguillulae PL171]
MFHLTLVSSFLSCPQLELARQSRIVGWSIVVWDCYRCEDLWFSVDGRWSLSVGCMSTGKLWGLVVCQCTLVGA